jgi:dihydrolipoamide dehydrogenase
MRDVIIIGAGPGGFDTAVFAKEQGLDVLLIEAGTIGGTCLNWGCIPTKALYHNAKTIQDLRHLDVFGVQLSSYGIDWNAIKTRKETIVANQIQNMNTTLSRLKIDYIEGRAQITSPHQVEVNGETHDTKHIVIATGSLPRVFPFEGDDLDIVVDSRGMLELNVWPKRLVVVGAGVIGVEMASIFRALGSEVTLVEVQDTILPGLDVDIQKRARNLYKRQGIDIHTSASMSSLRQEEGAYLATIQTKKGPIEVPTDLVLRATGRRPNFGGLALSELGVSFDQSGIQVDEFKQTSVPGIYAIGDVNGELMLAHKATYDGYRAISHMVGEPLPIRFDLVPSVVFSYPEIATIGRTEADLAGSAYRTHKALFKTSAKAECMNETDGFVKMIVDDKNELVGCHIIGTHASDLIHEVGGLMAQRITVDAYQSIIHAHPTLSEVLGECIKGLVHSA